MVAKSRVVYKEPLPPALAFNEINPTVIMNSLERDSVISGMLSKADRVPIGLPYDGDTFLDRTPTDFLNRLKVLKNVGYQFPDYVLDAVIDEIEDKEDEND
jgi:hypothetical protein